MSQLFAWGGQSTGVSALASFLSKNSQGWSPSEWTGWISLQSKGLSRVFSNTTVQKHQFFSAQLFFTVQLALPYMTTGKTVALTRRTLVGKVMSLLWTNKNLGNLQVRLWLWILNLWGAATLVLGRQTLADFPLDVLGPRPLSIALHSAEVKTALLSHFGCLFYFHNIILRPFPTYLVQSIFCTWSISFYKK